MIPVMLWVFQLYDKGWNWQYAALFGSMLGATDAVAIIGTMKASKFVVQDIGFCPCQWQSSGKLSRLA